MPPMIPDEQVRMIGLIVCTIGRVEWVAIEILRRLDPETPLANLATLPAGGIAVRLRNVARRHRALMLDADAGKRLIDLADEFVVIVKRRNDVMHARMATADVATREQGLYRWDPNRGAAARFVDLSEMQDILNDALDLDVALAAIRSDVPAGLL